MPLKKGFTVKNSLFGAAFVCREFFLSKISLIFSGFYAVKNKIILTIFFWPPKIRNFLILDDLSWLSKIIRPYYQWLFLGC
jgi:hypothetical protein